MHNNKSQESKFFNEKINYLGCLVRVGRFVHHPEPNCLRSEGEDSVLGHTESSAVESLDAQADLGQEEAELQ